MKKIIIVSGLPASGKTTLGQQIANALQFSFFDKDDYLEQLFEKHDSFDLSLRQELSRKSDVNFQKEAALAGDSVLTSFWRPLNSNSLLSGTPSTWITSLSNNPIEIYCTCGVTEAVNRFANRKRHKGHLDHLRSNTDLQLQFQALHEQGPLNIGKLITVDTTQEIELASLLFRIRKELLDT